ncbi:tetratricopeptide repeat protein [Jannaschia seohaensis]|uniref:TPR repeat n=1 Tax=Jannaschia seohaensis TaxID=475081 RepID=A0A2Y9C2C7_9RHOB|nr:tetratricopeptide repeat protein [Jannaschia seohaensis]PWJ15789.1 hypothetical protein BCF38_1109 [Jannaschia seohaensis]SSA49472.1 hypothetical protein SAMN05421539_1109 [Jannaschia seohaensis]
MPRLSLPALLALWLAAPVSAQTLPSEIADMLTRGDFAGARAALAPLAESGDDPGVMFRFGALLYQGQGGALQREEGLQWIARAADAGSEPAATTLARILLTGPSAGVARDPARAAAILAPVAEAGGTEAAYYLGLLYLGGTGVEADRARALELLTGAAEGGYAPAALELGRIFSEGPDADPAEAERWLRRAADAGLPEAQTRLGLALIEGTPEEGMRWLRRAADAGGVVAQRELGTRLLMGREDTPPNPTEAIRWLTSAAEAGDRSAMQNLALAYGGFQDAPRNDALAVQWYSRASDAGLARATYALANYVEAGRGVEADLKTAAQLYRTAFEQGDPRGAIRLGVLTGQGALDAWVPPHLAVDWTLMAARDGDAGARAWLDRQAEDGLRPAQTAYARLLREDGTPERAVPLLTAAAEAGDVAAQHLLALAFSRGEGVEIDYVAAHKWLNVAATSGHAEAAQLRETLGALMTPEQVAEAQAAARVFFQTAAPPEGLSGASQ